MLVIYFGSHCGVYMYLIYCLTSNMVTYFLLEQNSSSIVPIGSVVSTIYDFTMEPIGTGRSKYMSTLGTQALKKANDTASAIVQQVLKNQFCRSCQGQARTKCLSVEETMASKLNPSASPPLSSMVPLKNAPPLLHHRCFLQRT